MFLLLEMILHRRSGSLLIDFAAWCGAYSFALSSTWFGNGISESYLKLPFLQDTGLRLSAASLYALVALSMRQYDACKTSGSSDCNISSILVYFLSHGSDQVMQCLVVSILLNFVFTTMRIFWPLNCSNQDFLGQD